MTPQRPSDETIPAVFHGGPGHVVFNARHLDWRLDLTAAADGRVLRVNALAPLIGPDTHAVCRAVTGIADWKLAQGLDRLMRGLSQPGTSRVQSNVFLAALGALLKESPAPDIQVLRGALGVIALVQDGTLTPIPFAPETEGTPA